MAVVRRLGVGVVIPATDVTTMLLTAAPECSNVTQIACPPAAAYEALTDKRSLLELARRLDVTTPDTLVAQSAEQLRAAADQFGYPVVLKPARSRYVKGDRIVSTAVQVVNSPAELSQVADRVLWLADIPCLVQRFIPGHGAGIFALYGPQGPIAWFSHRRLREKPPSGGVSVLSESVPVDPTMRQAAERLLSAVHWVGVAMVEFRVTETGTPYLMEVNGRFWGSLQLAIDCGVDFPWLLLGSVTGSTVEAHPVYPSGRRLRWLLGDFDSLLIQLRSARLSVGEKARGFGRFMQSFVDPACRQEVLRWSDPRPGVREAQLWLAALRQ
jgi:predicted ATP-grasp superfamily ATP-dependent carboligase